MNTINNNTAEPKSLIRGFFGLPKLPPLLVGLISAALALLIGSLLLSLCFCYTSTEDSTIHALGLVLLGVSCLVGGFFSARSAGKKGLKHGGLVAATLLVLLLVYSLLGGAGLSPVALLIKGAVMLIGGALGGILGVA